MIPQHAHFGNNQFYGNFKFTCVFLRCLLALVAPACAWFAAGGVALAAARSPGPLPAPAAPLPFCAFGVDLYHDVPVTAYDLAPLGLGWYVDYDLPGTPHPPGMDYAAVIAPTQTGVNSYTIGNSQPRIDATLAANPGAIWLIGNEPDRRVLQTTMMPELYAQAYHDLYHDLKRKDPSVQIYAGNIVQPTPLRLEYLDKVLAAYQARFGVPMPVDGWSIHNFILNERSCAAFPGDCWGAEIPPGSNASEGMVIEVADHGRLDLFAAQIERFRGWMAANGYRDKPLLLTEYGILMPEIFGYPPAVVNDFMRRTFDYMLTATDPATGYPPDDNRLVQRFAWYATLEPSFNGALYASRSLTNSLTPPYYLTALGEHYGAYTAGLTPTVAVQVQSWEVTPAAIPPAGDPFTATVTLHLANRGNLATPSVVRAQLFDGLPAAGGVPVAPAQEVAIGSCAGTAAVTLAWPEVPAGGAASGTLAVALEVRPPAGLPPSHVVVDRPYFRPTHFVYAPVLAP
jgi:hypothetical protein